MGTDQAYKLNIPLIKGNTVKKKAVKKPSKKKK
jgi:hypothetical protein